MRMKHRSAYGIAVVLLVICGAAAAAPPPPEVVPVDGGSFAAELSAIDAQWQITFLAAEGPRVVPAADVVSWGSCVEPARGPLVLLRGGDLLVADVLAADKQKVSADSTLFGLVDLARDMVAGVVFLPPSNRVRRDLLVDRVEAARGDADRLILTNDDELAGSIESLRGDVVRIGTDLGVLDVELARVRAVLFRRPLAAPAPAQGLRAAAGFSDGSLLTAAQMTVDQKSLHVSLAGGLAWSTTPRKLVWLQPLGGRVTYLSDLKPADYRHLPYLDLAWPYYADRNVTGSRLRVGGQVYTKGLGVHSASRLTYLLDGSYRRFQCELALDDTAEGGGDVRFRVFVDGQVKYTSPNLVGGSPPLPISVDLVGAKRLDLVTDFAERADELDRADWLNARLVK